MPVHGRPRMKEHLGSLEMERTPQDLRRLPFGGNMRSKYIEAAGFRESVAQSISW
jgi:hypothetical protein